MIERWVIWSPIRKHAKVVETLDEARSWVLERKGGRTVWQISPVYSG